ncbi:ABC transporter substrate-binding protein [Puniceibacterium sp. IMCC21224]|uniref:ABC transporter substrate-binding protein n=1 Tax=Puniceibacterium sp. IMCC21224 TaxID=1618204 RepID=UPI00065D03D9|nr:ABC transporter substrate-binding protein [Puniceibacterium sp. IMCC21224]KMK65732.1 ABC-type Fe3+-hydroxamate transport system, periplasmic component [Puniceibacterium sp. IMCC21224]
MRNFFRSVVAPTALLLSVLIGAAQADTDVPSVVSMNLCTDQLAMLLAAPGQLLSVTRVSADPKSSPMAEAAAAYPLNNGHAEEIALFQPDIVLAGAYSDPLAIDMLRRIGVRVVQFPLTYALAEIPDQIRQIGQALNRPDAAEDMARDVERRLDSLPAVPEHRPLAAFFYANGYSLGTGTLGDDILTSAGFENLSTRLGRSQSGALPLEILVLAQPDALVSSMPYGGASRAEDLPQHPALRRYVAEDRVLFSTADWVCGTPFTLRAVEEMAAARLALTQRIAFR